MANKKKKNGSGQQFLSPERYLKEKARTLKIGVCYVSNDIDEMKLGHVFVTRRHTGGRISIACYLVDMACLGVKNSFYRLRMEYWEVDDLISRSNLLLRTCSYEEAHNRVWGSIAYAEEAGIKPDKSFALTQYMLEEDTEEVPLIEYEYGKDGKHFLVCHSELEASRYLPIMKKTLGEGNYNYLIGIGSPDLDGDEADDDDTDDDNTTIWGLPIEHVDMADIVKAKATEGIDYLSEWMGLGIESVADPDEKRRQYVDYILNNPKELLSCLPKGDIDTLLYIKSNSGKAKGVPTPNEELTTMLELACVADCYWNDQWQYCIRVADDFLRVALPLVADVRMSDEARQRYDVEAIVEGMANLYGEVTLEDAKRAVMFDHGGLRSEAGRLIDKAMEHSMLLNYTVAKIDDTKTGLFALADDNIVFCSRYAWSNLDAQRRAIGKQPPMPTQPFTDDDACRFTVDEVREAANSRVPIIPNARQKVFWHFLTSELGWDEYTSSRICFDLWYRANHIDDPDNKYDETIEEFFQDEALAIDDITPQKKKKGLRLLADYVAHIPRWSLKGHSPADIK